MFEHGQLLREIAALYFCCQDVWADLKYEPREGSTEQDFFLSGVRGTCVPDSHQVLQNMTHGRTKSNRVVKKTTTGSVTYGKFSGYPVCMMCIWMRSWACPKSPCFQSRVIQNSTDNRGEITPGKPMYKTGYRGPRTRFTTSIRRPSL